MERHEVEELVKEALKEERLKLARAIRNNVMYFGNRGKEVTAGDILDIAESLERVEYDFEL